jgi:hypothetical protein
MPRKTIFFIGLLIVAGVLYFKDDIETVASGFRVKAVDYQPPAKTVWLDQNVSAMNHSFGMRNVRVPWSA